MTVLLANAQLSHRPQVWDNTVRNAHGERLRGQWEDAGAFLDGRTNERADGGWDLAIDPSFWPVRQGDLVVDDQGAAWVVNTADLLQNNYDHTADWIRIDAHEREGGATPGTEPGGAEFVGRD